MLLAIALYEYFIDVKGIAVSLIFSLQSVCINGSEFDAAEANRFAAYCDAWFG